MKLAQLKLDVAIQLKHQAWKRLLRPYCKTTQALCQAVLEETRLARSDCFFEMAVVLADDAFIKELNCTYRGKDAPTNVLSFPSGDLPKRLVAKQTYALGDIVLAYETLEREAQEQHKDLKAHATHLITHGILHLLDYDHMTPKEAEQMEKLEIKILKKQNISNPYL